MLSLEAAGVTHFYFVGNITLIPKDLLALFLETGLLYDFYE